MQRELIIKYIIITIQANCFVCINNATPPPSQKTVDDYDKGTEVLFTIETLKVPIDSSKMKPFQWFDIAKRIKVTQ